MGTWGKVFLLLLLNIAIAGATLYFFDYMRIISYHQLLSNIPGFKVSVPIRIEDPLLLEKEELNKKWELLTIKELELSNLNLEVISNNLALESKQTELQTEREAFINEQTLIALKKEEANTYNIKINDVATQIAGMPPQTAAELLNLQDDLQVVDIFKKMDEIAAANGQASTVPFLLTLLEREKAARIQSLMLVNTVP